MTENISQSAEDRLLRMMADQSSEIEAMRKDFSERLNAIEKRPRRSLSGLLDMDFEGVAGMMLMFFAALILTRVLIYALAQMKRRGERDVSPSLSQA